jgi:predicted amidohydrolase
MSNFKIAAAQVASIRGELARNVRTHAAAIAAAAEQDVAVLVFAELSLMGYEPELASTHAISPTEARLDPIAEAAQRYGMHVIAGASLAGTSLIANGAKPALGAILFGPDGSRRTYAKMHLGGVEPNYFSAGAQPLVLDADGHSVGLSICADSAEPSHVERYARLGATIYSASVFLNTEWYATDIPRFARYAARHRLLVVMANHSASVGSYASVGQSAIWGPDGTLLAQAAGTEDALVIATRSAELWRAEVKRL